MSQMQTSCQERLPIRSRTQQVPIENENLRLLQGGYQQRGPIDALGLMQADKPYPKRDIQG